MTSYSGHKELEYYPSGKIKSYVTFCSDEFKISDQYVKVAESTKITFYPSGNIQSFYLADDTTLTCGRISKQFFEKERVEVSEDGAINLFSNLGSKNSAIVNNKKSENNESSLLSSVLDLFSFWS